MLGDGAGGGGAGGAGLGLDLSAVMQSAVVGLVLFSAAVVAVRRAASRYFVVDAAGFAASRGDHHHSSPNYQMGNQQEQRTAAAADLKGTCAACGVVRSKKCSGCKRVCYCSKDCQIKHWQIDHKFRCKQIKAINSLDNDARSGTSGPSRGRSKRRNDAKPVTRIEKTMSDFMSFEREQVAAKAQNQCQGQEFSMTRCLAVLKDMVDLSDDVKIQASEVFRDALNREIFLGYETRLRALWLTKEVNKLRTLSNAS